MGLPLQRSVWPYAKRTTHLDGRPSSPLGSKGVLGTSVTVHIKLYGEKADRFRDIKGSVAERLGYQPSNPEVVGLLMAQAERGRKRAEVAREPVQSE